MAEIEILRNALRRNPELKKTVSNLSKVEDLDTKKIVEENIKKQMSSIYMQGVCTGWSGFALAVLNNIENMTNVDEIKNYLKKESEKVKEKIFNECE